MTAWSEYCDRYNLTKTQARILAVLMDGEVHSAADLLLNGIGRRFACDHLVIVHISRLRSKISAHGFVVETVGRGRSAQGYRLITEAVAA